MIHFIIGAMIFLLSIAGISMLFNRYLNTRSEALPLISMASIGVAVIISGLLGVLKEGTYAIIGFGIVALIYNIIGVLTKKYDVKKAFSVGTVIFLIAFILLSLRLYNVTYTHYDNFSHWGTIVKELISFDSFPDENTVVAFELYPPATASFIYAFCLFCGYSEGITLIAQAMLLCGVLSVIFMGVDRKSENGKHIIPALILLSIVSLVFIRLDNDILSIYNLLTDGVQGCFLAAIIIIAFNSVRDKKSIQYGYIPLIMFMCMIKTNGFVFALFSFIAIVIINRLNAEKEDMEAFFSKGRVLRILLGIAPTVLYYFWAKYAESAYPQVFADVSGQEKIFSAVAPMFLYTAIVIIYEIISAFKNEKVRRNISIVSVILISIFVINKLSAYIAERSDEFISSFVWNFSNALFNTQSLNLWVFLAINVLMLVAIIGLVTHDRARKLLQKMVWLDMLVLGFILLMLIFYLAILPEDEASVMASFDRYQAALMVAYVISSMYMLIDEIKYCDKMVLIKSTCVSLVVCLICISNIIMLFAGPDYSKSERHRVKESVDIAKQYIPRNSSIMMYVGDGGRRDLYYYIMRYEFTSKHCMVLDYLYPEVSKANDTSRAREFDYFIVYRPNDAELEKMLSACGYSGYDGKSRLYKVERYDDRETITLIPVQ